MLSLDWANYILQTTDVDGLDIGLVNASGRNMAANSLRPYAIGDILRVRYFLSPMGCTSRSSYLSRLGKVNVINKLGWAVDVDKVDLDMALFMTNIHIYICYTLIMTKPVLEKIEGAIPLQRDGQPKLASKLEVYKYYPFVWVSWSMVEWETKSPK